MQPDTPRICLRQWRAEDRAPFFELNSEPAVRRHLTPLTREGSDAMLDRIDAQFAENGWGFWALEDRRSGTLIGMCGLARIPWTAFFTPAVEIGWRLSTPWHGKGFAREAAEAVLAYGFRTLRLDRIVSFTTPANTASWGLMRRLGMHEMGEFDHPGLPEGHPLRRHVAYEINAPEAGESP